MSFKVYFGQDIRRFVLSDPRIVDVRRKISDLFSIDHNEIHLSWRDEDGDLIPLQSEEDLRTALQCNNGVLRVLVTRGNGEDPEPVSTTSTASSFVFEAAQPTQPPVTETVASVTPAPAPAPVAAPEPSFTPSFVDRAFSIPVTSAWTPGPTNVPVVETRAPEPAPAPAPAPTVSAAPQCDPSTGCCGRGRACGPTPTPTPTVPSLGEMLGQVLEQLQGVGFDVLSAHFSDGSSANPARGCGQGRCRPCGPSQPTEQAPRAATSASATSPVHFPNVVCDGCGSQIFTRRYKCCVCPDFDLCVTCEAAGLHPEHTMLRISDPDVPRFGLAGRGFGFMRPHHHGWRHGGGHGPAHGRPEHPGQAGAQPDHSGETEPQPGPHGRHFGGRGGRRCQWAAAAAAAAAAEAEARDAPVTRDIPVTTRAEAAGPSPAAAPDVSPAPAAPTPAPATTSAPAPTPAPAAELPLVWPREVEALLDMGIALPIEQLDALLQRYRGDVAAALQELLN